jgi:hypothetical protein
MTELMVGPFYQNGTLRMLPHTNAGVPTNGTSGTQAGLSGIGSLLIDTVGGGLYQNAGTVASPTWALVSGGLLGSTALSKQLSVAGAGNGADTTEDTLFTYSLPANALAAVGNEVDIMAWGSVPATSATKTARLYFGAVVTTVTYTTTQTGAWQMQMRVIKQAANVQLVIAELDSLGATVVRSIAVTNNGAEVDTAAIVIKVTGQSSAATANLVLCNGFTVAGAV